MKARITEIFSSIQGEGPLLGTPMIFIRFGGCHLRCQWCDEPDSLEPNSGQEMTPQEVLAKVEFHFAQQKIEWVSLTGGEPLLKPAFIKELAPELKKRGFKILLETSGNLAQPLSAVAEWIDSISMDVKLPSAKSTPYSHELLKSHDRFLSIGAEKSYIKIVVTQETSTGELSDAFDLIRRYPQAKPVFLQPATPRGGAHPPHPRQLEEFHRLAWKSLPQPVRVLPQLHPYWKLP